ncbi:MAG: chalcone isomerase family protein [Burkholderiaceae bacterium]
MRRRTCLGSLALLSVPPAVRAADGEAAVPPELQGLRPLGQARMRFLGLAIYDIRLWARERIDAARWSEQDLALEIVYARSLSGREIAKRSLAEMRRQGEIAAAQAQAWLAEMEATFPDVKAGDRISGLFEPGLAARFYVNGRLARRIADARFARLFFGIWLAPQTSEPALRERLLGAPDGGA